MLIQEFDQIVQNKTPIEILELGQKYEVGVDCIQSIETAANLYTLAELEGNIDAMVHLAILFEKGLLSTTHSSKAYVDRFIIASDQGNAFATYCLGRLYEKGKGIEKDLKKAFEHYIKSSKLGVRKAIYQVGMFLENHKVLIQDLECYPNNDIPCSWFLQAAKKGDAHSQFKIAQQDEIEQKYDTAVMWYQLAADQEIPEAQYKVWQFYINNKVENIDSEDAKLYLQSAATHGHIEARFEMGKLCEDEKDYPLIISDASFWFEKAAKSGHAESTWRMSQISKVDGNISKAYLWALKATKLEHKEAMYFLGSLYEKGYRETSKAQKTFGKKELIQDEFIINPSYEKAFEWYKKASEKNHATALWKLSLFYKKGLGVEKSLELAQKFLLEASENNSPDAQYQLALDAFNNPDNQPEGIRWLLEAAKNNHPCAQYDYGMCCYHGDGVPQSDKEAEKWIINSHNLENLDATCQLGTWIETNEVLHGKNIEDALELYNKAAKKGHVEAQYRLGCCYRYYAVDYTESVKWLTKAAGSDHPDAMSELGDLHSHGFGTEISSEKALQLWRNASELGHIVAAIKFVDHLTMAQNQPFEIHPEDLSAFDLAADNGHIEAQFHLGLYHKNNSRDYENGGYWLQQAAESGHIEATVELAEMYKKGLGTPIALEKARDLYLIAANKNHPQACYEMAFLMNHLHSFQNIYSPFTMWLIKAAKLGVDLARKKLRNLYLNKFLGIQTPIGCTDITLKSLESPGNLNNAYCKIEVFIDFISQKTKNVLFLQNDDKVNVNSYVEGFARELIWRDDLPTNLYFKQIFSLNLSEIIEEDKENFLKTLKTLAKELSERKAILFIDHVHLIFNQVNSTSSENLKMLNDWINENVSESKFRFIFSTDKEINQTLPWSSSVETLPIN